MQKSYTSNYLKIYLWQGISLILNFLSMFIVIPYLTSDPTTYGIYSVCVSFSIFLSYADLGFMGAGQKYAAEYFANGNKEEEIKVIGFTNFILAVFLVLFFIVFILMSIYPESLVKGINTTDQKNIASTLLLTLAIFTPTTLLQRMLQMIYGIRMEDFIIQRTNIIGNIFKISSIFWFFRNGNYNITGYFIFTQFINLIAVLITAYIAKKRYDYNFTALIKAFYFNKKVFDKTKKLAFTSLFLTIAWILYYELDTIAIGKIFGTNEVAIYSIGLTILTLFRSVLGILFSPFNVRFNHFIGINEEISLKSFYFKIVTFLAPIVVFPILSIFLFANSIVLTWVGEKYLSSVSVIQFLVLCNLFAFITYPTNFMLIAKERQKELYLINILIPIVFWFGILVSLKYWGINSFAIFKLVAFIISASILYKIMTNYLKISLWNSIKNIFVPMTWSIFFLILMSFFIENYLPKEKSTINLLIIASVLFIGTAISLIIHYFSSENWRIQINKTIRQLTIK